MGKYVYNMEIVAWLYIWNVLFYSALNYSLSFPLQIAWAYTGVYIIVMFLLI